MVACTSVLWFSAAARAQVSEVIARDLGASREVRLAVLGPANWRKLNREDREDTRLGFVETRTGRVILDLKARGFSWFSDEDGAGGGPYLVTPPAVTDDRTRIAVMARWRRSVELALFEITGTSVREVPFELPGFIDVLRIKHPEIPPARTLRLNNISAVWKDGGRLEALLSGTLTDNEDKLRNVQVRCVVEMKGGRAGVLEKLSQADFYDDPPVNKRP